MTGEQALALALDFVLTREGGYVLAPRDPGGETNFGISKRAYSHVDIQGLTRERAAEIYHRDYWSLLGADMLAPAVAASEASQAMKKIGFIQPGSRRQPPRRNLRPVRPVRP